MTDPVWFIGVVTAFSPKKSLSYQKSNTLYTRNEIKMRQIKIGREVWWLWISWLRTIPSGQCCQLTMIDNTNHGSILVKYRESRSFWSVIMSLWTMLSSSRRKCVDRAAKYFIQSVINIYVCVNLSIDSLRLSP